MLPGCHCAEGPASSSPGRDGDCLQARGGAWRPPRLCREEAEGAGPCVPLGGRAGLHGVPGPAGVWGQPTDADRRRPGGQIATGRADPEARCRGAEGACPPREAQTADPTDREGVHLGTENGGGMAPPPQGAALRVGVGTHRHAHMRVSRFCSHTRHSHTCGAAHLLTRAPAHTPPLQDGLWAPGAPCRWPLALACHPQSLCAWTCHTGGPGVWRSRLCWGRARGPSPHTRAGWGRGPRAPPEPRGNTQVGGPRGTRGGVLGWTQPGDPGGPQVPCGCTKPSFPADVQRGAPADPQTQVARAPPLQPTRTPGTPVPARPGQDGWSSRPLASSPLGTPLKD